MVIKLLKQMLIKIWTRANDTFGLFVYTFCEKTSKYLDLGVTIFQTTTLLGIFKMLFFVAFALNAVAYGWVSMSVDKNKCIVRPGRVYTGKQLRRKCPDAFKCTTGQTVKSGESIKNYEECYQFSCNCGSTGKDYSLNT